MPVCGRLLTRQGIERNAQVGHAVLVSRGEMPGAYVDLNRRQDQRGQIQRGIAGGAHGHKLVFADAVFDMNVVAALRRHRGLPLRLARLGRVVMADADQRFWRQLQDALDRAVQLARIAARKVGPGRAHIGHEQGIADKHGAVDPISHISRRVTGHQQRGGRHRANHEGLTVAKQVVELAAVRGKTRFEIKHLAKHRLHALNMLANGGTSAGLLLHMLRRRKVVGMGVSLQNPVHLQLLVTHKIQHGLDRARAGVAGLEVVVQHRVNDGGMPAGVLPHHIGDGSCGGIIKSLGRGQHAHENLLGLKPLNNQTINRLILY